MHYKSLSDKSRIGMKTMAQNKIANLLLIGGILFLFLYCLAFGVTSNAWWKYILILGGYLSPFAILTGLSMKILGFLDRFRN